MWRPHDAVLLRPLREHRSVRPGHVHRPPRTHQSPVNSIKASRKSSATSVTLSPNSSSPLLSRSVQYRPRIRVAGRPDTCKNAEPLCIRLRCSTRLSGLFRYMYVKDAPVSSSERLASDEREADSSVSSATVTCEADWRTTRNTVFGSGLLFVAGSSQNDVRVPLHVPLTSRGTRGSFWIRGSPHSHRSHNPRTIVAISTAREKNRSQPGFTTPPVDQIPTANTRTTTAVTTCTSRRRPIMCTPSISTLPQQSCDRQL